MNGLSQKRYLELPLPTEDDPRSDQQRILDSLAAAGVEERVHMPVHILRKLYPLLDNEMCIRDSYNPVIRCSRSF